MRQRVKPKRPLINEAALHRSVAEFLDWVLLPPAIWTTFPAGWTDMRKGAAGRLKGCGLKAGMPDILIFHGNGCTMGIELKSIPGKLSKFQLDMFTKLDAAGLRTYVSRSLEDVYNALIIEDVPRKKVYFDGHASTEARRPPQPDAGPPQAA
jgi:hypothetical protein